MLNEKMLKFNSSGTKVKPVALIGIGLIIWPCIIFISSLSKNIAPIMKYSHSNQSQRNYTIHIFVH